MKIKLFKMKFARKHFFHTLSYLLFLVIGIFFLKKIFNDSTELTQIYQTLKSVNPFAFLIVILVAVVGHFIRALRWKLLLNNAGEKVSVTPLYWSLLFGYFINYLVPRLGEIYRCVSLNKVTKIPVAKVFATVLVERVVDIMTLLVILPTVFFIQYDRFEGVLSQYVIPFVLPKWNWIREHYLLISLLIVMALIAFFFINQLLKKNNKVSKIQFIQDLWSGLLSLRKVKKLPLFLVYTLLIWGYYFVTNYACLYMLDTTLTAKWSAAVSTGTFGSIARSLPIAGGGMGAYHQLVTEVLLVYGVTTIYAKSMSIIFHGSQLLFQFVMGITGGIWIYTKKAYQ